MKVFGDINIRGTFMVDGKDYEGGFLRVDDDTELRNIVGPEDGEVALTLNDGLFNVYYLGTDDWVKWHSWVVPVTEDFNVLQEHSSLTFTDRDNTSNTDLNFYLPSATSGLIYTFVKTRYAEFYDFSIVPYGGDYIDDVDGQILRCNANELCVATIISINARDWIVINTYGTWFYV